MSFDVSINVFLLYYILDSIYTCKHNIYLCINTLIRVYYNFLRASQSRDYLYSIVPFFSFILIMRVVRYHE